MSYADYCRNRPDSDGLPPDDTCPTCDGDGEVAEAHESYAVEMITCPHCGGTGHKHKPGRREERS
jgi:DnaJ-class molecular chaperone